MVRHGLLGVLVDREHTVVTPGSDDRGARRIVPGRDGAMDRTADQYDPLAWIDR